MKKPSSPALAGIVIGKKQGSSRKSPSALAASGGRPNAERIDRLARDVGIAPQQRGDLRLALLGLQRADAIDQAPARFQQATARSRIFGWIAASVAMSPRLLGPRHVRVRRMVPVAEQGASTQNGVERLGAV